MDHLSKKWTLESLTIGPQCETNTQFWEEAFKGLPPLPRVGNVTIIERFSTAKAVNMDCWRYFDHILARRDLFPALKLVNVHSSTESQQLSHRTWSAIYNSLRGVRSRTLMGGKLLAFERDYRANSTIPTARWP